MEKVIHKQLENRMQEGFLVFTVGKQQFGLPVSVIRRVIRSVKISPVPESPQSMLGIINYHGESIPVINFRKKLGFPGRRLSPKDIMIVVRTPGTQLAMVVDQVNDLTDPVYLNDCPVDLIIPGQEKEIEGLVHVDKQIVLIYNLEAIFSRDADMMLKLNAI